MAEIQWVIEVRCVNTLLGEIKVDEKGEHACVTVPDRTFDPSEFEKLIEGLDVASRVLSENRQAYGRTPTADQSAPLEPALGTVEEIDRRDGLYRARLLKSGELVSLDVQGELLAPSELERLIAEVKLPGASSGASQGFCTTQYQQSRGIGELLRNKPRDRACIHSATGHSSPQQAVEYPGFFP